MITALIVIGSIMTYFLIGHLVWRIGLKVAFDEAKDLIFICHFFWFFAIIVFMIEADYSTPKFFQKIIDENDPWIKRENARKKQREIEDKERAYKQRITELEIDNGISPSYPEFAWQKDYR